MNISQYLIKSLQKEYIKANRSTSEVLISMVNIIEILHNSQPAQRCMDVVTMSKRQNDVVCRLS